MYVTKYSTKISLVLTKTWWNRSSQVSICKKNLRTKTAKLFTFVGVGSVKSRKLSFFELKWIRQKSSLKHDKGNRNVEVFLK